MVFSKTLKYIREKKGISQNKMLDDKDASQYSRIEGGKSQLRISTLIELSERLGLTLNEFIKYSFVDKKSIELSQKMNYSIDNPDSEYHKFKLIKEYKKLDKLNKKLMTYKDFAYYYAIKSTFSRLWKDIEPPSTDEIDHIYHMLVNSEFYGQFDYLLAINIITFFNTEQIDNLITRMFPVRNPDKKTDVTLNYANLLITNVISLAMYEMDYEAALRYVTLALNNNRIRDNYYFHLNTLYHKNMILRFLENDTKYIEKAREIIQIIYDIGDTSTADQFLEELNTLNTNPIEYKNRKNMPTVSIHK